MTHPCFVERLLLLVLSLLYLIASTTWNLCSFEALPVQGTLSKKLPMSDTNSDLSVSFTDTNINKINVFSIFLIHRSQKNPPMLKISVFSTDSCCAVPNFFLWSSGKLFTATPGSQAQHGVLCSVLPT